MIRPNPHKNANKSKLEEFKNEISKKYNLEFGLVNSIFANGGPVVAHNKRVQKGHLWEKLDPNTALNVKNVKHVSQDQALQKLKRKLSHSGINEEIHPVPKGRPVFMLGYTKGKTRPLVTLYDTGCGTVLFREGVPQRELAPAQLRQSGPFLVNGVGDTAVQVNSEWMCSTSLNDSTRQALEGWTVNKITATLPKISMTVAEAEIKADDMENEELQSLCCPSRPVNS